MRMRKISHSSIEPVKDVWLKWINIYIFNLTYDLTLTLTLLPCKYISAVGNLWTVGEMKWTVYISGRKYQFVNFVDANKICSHRIWATGQRLWLTTTQLTFVSFAPYSRTTFHEMRPHFTDTLCSRVRNIWNFGNWLNKRLDYQYNFGNVLVNLFLIPV